MLHTIEFWLPFPPSTNRLWRAFKGGVVISKEYKHWKIAAADAIIVTQKLGHSCVLGSHQMNLILSDRFASNRDGDNRVKGVLDICQSCGLIVDDSICSRSSVEWQNIDHECLVKLTGEVAYHSQWEFAEAKARQQAERARMRQRQADRQSRALRMR